MARQRKVLVLIESSRAYEQGILRGIAQYSRLHGPWYFFRNIPAVSGGKQITVSEIKKLGVDGIIIREQKNLADIMKLGIPTVISPYSKTFSGFINIVTDDAAIGKMAAEYLLERGFRHFAFWGNDPNFFWSVLRCDYFTNVITKAGFKVETYEKPRRKSGHLHLRQLDPIAEWLNSLPKPIAIMVATDDFSHDLFEAIKSTRFHVPEDVAVIGLGNDEIVCGFASPPLTSIVLNAERAGYEAAEKLDRLIGGEKVKHDDIVIHPLHVVTRNSTDVLAIEDADVAKAVRFIRQHTRDMIQVDDVVEAVAISRRSLYKKFEKTLGRSIYQEIRRVRVEQAARLLLETSMSVAQIARSLGYPDLKNMSRVFQQEKNMSLLAYRKKYGRA
jgi:LacI family transcriptional regulator